MDLLNEGTEGGRERERRRGDGRVKERTRIVLARESVSKNNGLQHPPTPLFVLMKT